jgi:hypothetical protein
MLRFRRLALNVVRKHIYRPAYNIVQSAIWSIFNVNLMALCWIICGLASACSDKGFPWLRGWVRRRRRSRVAVCNGTANFTLGYPNGGRWGVARRVEEVKRDEGAEAGHVD